MLFTCTQSYLLITLPTRAVAICLFSSAFGRNKRPAALHSNGVDLSCGFQEDDSDGNSLWGPCRLWNLLLNPSFYFSFLISWQLISLSINIPFPQLSIRRLFFQTINLPGACFTHLSKHTILLLFNEQCQMAAVY